MGRLYVCSLTKVVDTVRTSGARSLVTILTAGASMARPCEIAPQQHLRIAVSDIEAPRGRAYIARDEPYRAVARLRQGLGPRLPSGRPLLRRREPVAGGGFHHRLRPDADARGTRGGANLRRASPTATPNLRLIGLADRILNRRGRMIEAIAEIGRGTECFEGTPFALELRLIG